MNFATSILPGGTALAVGALAGAIIGSFIATIAVRWPDGRQVRSGRSACDDCGAVLHWWELLPVFSWLLLRGRCRRCGGAIAPDHLLIELMAAGIGAAALTITPHAGGVALALLGWQLLLLGWLDARHYWLPHLLSALLASSGLAFGGAAMAAIDLAVPLADRLIGAVAGCAMLTLLALAYRQLRGREGLGGGDAPMLGGIGAWIGWTALPPLLLLASLAGLAVALVRLTRARRRGEEAKAMTMKLPLGTLMAISTPVILLLEVSAS